MIEELDPVNSPPEVIIEKLNELIHAYNNHYHVSMDTHYKTTYPKAEDKQKEEQT